ncbi:STAS domain-containing protein [Nonomuraea sp. NPDC050783]|uniref:STAS domain-containing protein n=1 Tax=Nonomuraea sp. NPDC050783 TaxID=3154634 RepID=UPI003467CB24
MPPTDPAAGDDFSIRIRTFGGVLLIQLDGPLSGTPVDIVRMYLMRTLVTQPLPALVVDLAGVTALEEAGREVLRSATGQAREAGGRLVVTGVPPLLGTAGEAGLDLLPTMGDGLTALGAPQER